MDGTFKTIPHDQHRYPTYGDYLIDNKGKSHFMISDIGNEDMEFLCLIHELIEEHLTRRRGITEPTIKAFDEQFESDGREGEPGEAHDSPYRKEHIFAENIERLIALELGVDWAAYGEAVDGLFK